MSGDDAFYAAAERRIEYLTVGIGVAAALAVGVKWGVYSGIGIAVGTLLSWLNFRWMKQGISALARLASAHADANANADAEKPRIPKSAYAKFLGRYVLLIIVAYVILRGFRSMGLAVLAGLFAGVAAVLTELIFQLFQGGSPRL